MTVNVDIHDAEAQLSRLLERVTNGERVVILPGLGRDLVLDAST